MRTRSTPVRVRLLIAVSVVGLAIVGIPAVASASHGDAGDHATAELVAAPGGPAIGQVVFHQLGDGSPNIAVDVEIDADSGLEPGIHGFHIHANDSGANNGCEAAIDDPGAGPFGASDGHYNPGGNDHGAHAGDLPVLHVNEDGSARKVFVTRAFTITELTGPNRAVIIHSNPDNYANIPDRYQHVDGEGSGPDETTRNTGDAGSRVACGVIQVDEEPPTLTEPETGQELGTVFNDATGAPVGFGAVVDNTGNLPGVSIATFLGLVGEPGFHGFHLHAGNRCQFEAGSVDFSYAQGHYNPDDSDHGNHAGDLPVQYMNPAGTNDQEMEGALTVDVYDRFEIDQASARTLVVHQNPDNYANIPPERYQTDEGAGPDSETLAGGDSGGRLACAMIEGLVRLWGQERIATSVEISQDSFLADGTAGAAVLARADRFPDALAGVPLAEDKGGPILLTRTGELPQATADELQRVLPEGQTVYLLGGPHAIDDSVEQAVGDLGYTTVRLEGETRFETGIAIAGELDETHDTIFVTTGLQWPDAVSSGGAAAQEDAVILFSAGDAPHGSTDAYLEAHDGAPVHAIGGPAARAYPDANPVFGDDRNETSVAVAEEFLPDGTAYVGLARDGASGGDDDDRFADALTGGVQVGRLGGTVLLVDEEILPEPVRLYLQDNASTVQRLFAYGGELAISEEVAAEAEDEANQASGIPVTAGSSSDGSNSDGTSVLERVLQER